MTADDREVVEDGFGGRWVKHGPDCDLQVVRPGKVQCECLPERTPQDDTGRLSIDDLTGQAMREMFREMDDAYRAASAAFAADDMEAWIEHAGRGAELFEKFARLNGWREERP